MLYDLRVLNCLSFAIFSSFQKCFLRLVVCNSATTGELACNSLKADFSNMKDHQGVLIY
jgi:hypothetical protein